MPAGCVTDASPVLGVDCNAALVSDCGPFVCERGASSANAGLGGGNGGEAGNDCAIALDAVTHADNVAAHALRSARRSLIVRADVNAHTQVICARANEDARCGRNVCVIATKREHDVIVADNEIVGWIKTNPPKLRA